MDGRISVLKENQQILGNKITMLQKTNRKKDEEADKIRELIAECRQNFDRIKCETINSSRRAESQPESECSRQRSKCPPGEGNTTETIGERQSAPCGTSRILGRPQSSETNCDPCAKFRSVIQSQPCNHVKSSCGNKPEDPCGKYRNKKLQPCETAKSPCDDFYGQFGSTGSTAKDHSKDSTNTAEGSNGPCESGTSTIRTRISALADAQEKSRLCIEKLGERMEREVKIKFVQGNANECSQLDACESDTYGYQERVSCRVDLNKMKVNIRGPPEDLKKLDAVQLINLLDKFQCQELVLNTGDNGSHSDLKGEVPVFYITHPGNLAVIVGIVMVAFLVNANLCSTSRGCRTKLLLNMLYLGSFAFHYGIVLWMGFIRGLILSVGLPREFFNTVDNLILPKYFSICVFLSALTLYSFLATHCSAPCTSWPLPVIVQVIIESATFLMELITICYMVPAIVKLRQIADEFSSEDEDCPPPESYCRNMEKLAKLNRTITAINILTVMFMGSNMYYISSKLNTD